jgi:hypothetical protein
MDGTGLRRLLAMLLAGVAAGALLMLLLGREPDVEGLYATAGCGSFLGGILPLNDPLAVEIAGDRLTVFGKRRDETYRLLEARRSGLDWTLFVVDPDGETHDWRIRPGATLETGSGECRVTAVGWPVACEAIFAPRAGGGGPAAPERCAPPR